MAGEPTVHGTWATTSLTSAATGSATRSAGASTKAAVAIVTAAQGGAAPAEFLSSGGSLSYGNVPLVKIPTASLVARNNIGTTRWRRVEFFRLTDPTDFAGRDDDVFRWTAPTNASSWELSCAILDHTGTIGVIAADTFLQDGGSGTGAADSDVILDPGAVDGLGLVASLCDNTVTNKTGQTTIASLFSGVHHSMHSIDASVPSIQTMGHVRAFGSGPWVAGGILLGDGAGDIEFEPDADVVWESGGAGLVIGGDSAFPVPGVNVGWETGGAGLTAGLDLQVRLASLDGVETPQETEGGTSTDEYLQRVPGGKPIWSVPAGSGGGGSIAVEETDGAPSVDPASTLQFDPGLVVSEPVAGTARVTPDWGEDADYSTQAFGDSPSAGASAEVARASHKHGMPASPSVPSFATPSIALGSSPAAGAASTVIRSDSTIEAFDGTAPTTQAFGDAAATGAAAKAARRDHKHAMPADPVTAHEAASDPHTGYLKESDVSGFATPAVALGTAAAAGAATTAIRSDSTIVAFDATSPTTQAFGDAAAVGAAAVAARRDHKHAMMADPVTAHAAASDPHTGYLKESDVSGRGTPALTLGTSNATGSATTVIGTDATIAAFDATAPVTQAFGDAAAAGSAGVAARRDHVHGMPGNPVSGGTGVIQLLPGAATLPDGSSGNAAPAISRVKGTETNPKKHYLIAAFDPSTDEHLWWTFQMPPNYASGGEVRILWYTNDTGANETCVWGARLGAITPADADTPIEHASAAATTQGDDANTTEANRLITTTITLGNLDSVAANDLVFLLVYRDADAGADDLTSDALLVSVQFRYTLA